RFFDDSVMERQLLDIVRGACDRSGFWEKLSTDWAVLDCELMPWSAKAQELIQKQYAAVGAAARSALPQAVAALTAAKSRGLDVGELGEAYAKRQALASEIAA